MYHSFLKDNYYFHRGLTREARNTEANLCFEILITALAIYIANQLHFLPIGRKTHLMISLRLQIKLHRNLLNQLWLNPKIHQRLNLLPLILIIDTRFLPLWVHKRISLLLLRIFKDPKLLLMILEQALPLRINF